MRTLPALPIADACALLDLSLGSTNRFAAWMITLPALPAPAVSVAMRVFKMDASPPAVTTTVPARPVVPDRASLTTFAPDSVSVCA